MEIFFLMENEMDKKRFSLRRVTVTAIMSAAAAVLMLLEFSVPLVPSFLKFDFSDLPAVITSFALGPVWGVTVELIKNVINLAKTQTGGVGELANFIIGVSLVLPAGLVYKLKKDRAGALIGSIAGAVFASAISIPVNIFITYPVYASLMGSEEKILALYRAILPSVKTLSQAIIVFNTPFTLVKGAVNVLITFLLYKRLSPVIKGTK